MRYFYSSLPRIVFSLTLLMGLGQAQTTLSTAGPTGSTMTTDDYGIINSWVIGTAGTPLTWMDHHSLFVVLNGGTPVEVSSANMSLWDGVPAEPVASGFFLPNRFEDWSYDGTTSPNVWHSVVEYHATGIDLVGGIGYRLIDPSRLLGAGYVDWEAAFHFTNTNASPLTIKAFRNIRLNSTTSTTTYYSNHDDLGPVFWDNDNIDGTADDYVVSFRNDRQTYFFGAYPLANYRIQSYTAAPSIYDRLTNGAADYNLPTSVVSVNGAQGEIGFQYESITLEQDQSALFWLPYKVFKLENSATNYPISMDWDSTNVSAADLNNSLVFAGTDVAISYSSMTYATNGGGTTADNALAYVVEVRGGIVQTPVSAPLNNVSSVRYWEIFYDTRRGSSTADITFTYDPATDGIVSESNLTLAYRTDYSQNWQQYNNIILVDEVNNTITAMGVDLGNSQWILASLTADNPLPVQLSSFTARGGENKVILNWETRSEVDNRGFILERRSAEETDFRELVSYQTETALKGAGNSSQRNSYRFTDNSVLNGTRYEYRLSSQDADGKIHRYNTVSATPGIEQTDVPGETILPREFSLEQNYPNPFNPQTTIRFNIPRLNEGAIQTNLSIYNMSGQKVATLHDGPLEAGSYAVKWNATDISGRKVPSGIYLYVLSSARFKQTRKLVLLK